MTNYQKIILKLKSKNIIPWLAVILVGNNPASKIYVRSKTKKFKELGILSKTVNVDSKISETELIAIIEELNNDNNWHDYYPCLMKNNLVQF